MEPLSSQVTEKSNQRRSQRVLLSLPVQVTGQTPDEKPVSEQTRTLVVNAHGALLHLEMRVSIGQLLTLKNVKTNEETPCRVVYANPAQGRKIEVGVEFMKPSPFFWRISFPPADWTTRSPDAKDFSAPPAQRSNPKPIPRLKK